MNKILIIDDDRELCALIKRSVQSEHIEAEFCNTGKEGLQKLKEQKYQLVVLDVMMPGMDGFETLEEIRKENSLPILMFTSKNDSISKVRGLRAGADDYLTKPFAMGEFLARVRAMLRRREAYTPDILTYGNFSLDRNTCLLQREGKDISMSRLEFRLMELLMLNPGVYFSAEKILERVWGYDTEAQVGTVWVYISYLRRKLSDLGADAKIVSRRNIGYALEAEV